MFVEGERGIFQGFRKDVNTGEIVSVPVIEKTNVYPNKAYLDLDEIPNSFYNFYMEDNEGNSYVRVKSIEALTEENQYYVDFEDCKAYVHENAMGKGLILKYYGMGGNLISAKRVILSRDENGNVIKSLEDLYNDCKDYLTELESLGTAEEVMIMINQKIVEGNEALQNVTDQTNLMETKTNTCLQLLSSEMQTCQTALDNKVKACKATIDEKVNIATTTIETVKNDGITNITNAKTTAEAAIETAKTTAINEVNKTKQTSVSAVETAKTEAITEINTTKDNAISEINTTVVNCKNDLDTKVTTVETDIDTYISNKTTTISDLQTTLDSRITKAEGLKADLGDIYTEVTRYQAQINKDLKDFKASLYSVGDIYISMIDNQETILTQKFGGTWVKISGGSYVGIVGDGTDKNGESKSISVGYNGGEYKHTLTIEELPSHDHPQVVTAMTPSPGTASRVDYASDGAGQNFSQGANTSKTGGGQSFNICTPVMGFFFYQKSAE